MRIAVWHNLPSGGGKRALYDQIRGLVARGHEVEAWCPPTADRSYLPLSNLIPEHVVPLKLSSYLWSSPGQLRKLHPFRWNAWVKLLAIEEHSRECARQISEKGCDLLFAACCMLLQTPAIGRFADVPSVVYLQEPNRQFYESLPELPWLALSWKFKDLFQAKFWRRALLHRGKLLRVRVLGRAERRNAEAYDEILVNSLYSRESVLRAFGIDSKVCYLGVDTEKFVNQEKTREPFVVSVGALIPSKNVEFLIESVERVSALLRPRLVLVTNTINPLYADRIKKQALEAGVNLELKHRIDDSELVDILNRAWVMLYAPRLEPFGYAPRKQLRAVFRL